MSARKQRRVGNAQDSTNPEPIKSADGDGSDSESSGGTGRASSFRRKKSRTCINMSVHRSLSDCDLNSRKETKPVKPKSPQNSSHKIVADLGAFVPYVGGILQQHAPNVRGPSSANALIGRQLSVDCQCGDTWQNRYKELTKGRRYTSESKRIDRVLQHLASEGHAIQDILHSGKFGAVFLAYSKFTAQNEVIKITHGDKLLPDDPLIFKRTLDVHQHLRHPSIVQLLSYSHIRSSCCLIMEWCENGSLQELLEKSPGNLLPEEVGRKYYQDLVSGISYLHQKKVVHLNLNSKNVLITRKSRLKICDFSNACYYSPGDVFPDGHRINFFGHLPPEVFSSATMVPRFNPRQADIWASGVLLFQIISGRLPFGQDESNTPALNVSERRGVRPAFAISAARFSPNLRDLLHHVLNPSPERRASLQHIMAHPFLCRKSRHTYIGNSHLIGPLRKVSVGPLMDQLTHDHGI